SVPVALSSLHSSSRPAKRGNARGAAAASGLSPSAFPPVTAPASRGIDNAVTSESPQPPVTVTAANNTHRFMGLTLSKRCAAPAAALSAHTGTSDVLPTVTLPTRVRSASHNEGASDKLDPVADAVRYGRYQLVERLAVGGMAEIFRAK